MRLGCRQEPRNFRKHQQAYLLWGVLRIGTEGSRKLSVSRWRSPFESPPLKPFPSRRSTISTVIIEWWGTGVAYCKPSICSRNCWNGCLPPPNSWTDSCRTPRLISSVGDLLFHRKNWIWQCLILRQIGWRIRKGITSRRQIICLPKKKFPDLFSSEESFWNTT